MSEVTASTAGCERCSGSRDVWLMGSGEIATLLSLSRQRVQQLAERDDFPAPAAELNMGRAWFRTEIEAWAAQWRQGMSR